MGRGYGVWGWGGAAGADIKAGRSHAAKISSQLVLEDHVRGLQPVVLRDKWCAGCCPGAVCEDFLKTVCSIPTHTSWLPWGCTLTTNFLADVTTQGKAALCFALHELPCTLTSSPIYSHSPTHPHKLHASFSATSCRRLPISSNLPPFPCSLHAPSPSLCRAACPSWSDTHHYTVVYPYTQFQASCFLQASFKLIPSFLQACS